MSDAPPIRQMLRFIATIMTFWLGAHAFMVWRALIAADMGLSIQPLAWSVTLTFAFLVLLFLLLGRLSENNVVRTFRTWALAYGGSASVVFAACVVATVVAEPLGFISNAARQYVTMAGFAIGGLTALAALVGGRRKPKRVEIDVPIPELHPDLEGYRILMLSDIHVGSPTTGKQFAHVVDETLAMRPDLIALVGDLVDGSVAGLANDVAPMTRLRARDGAYFVTGNHEYYSNSKPWEAAVTEAGLTVLNNRHVTRTVGDATVVIAGVTDTSAAQFYPEDASDPAAALANTSDADFRLLLAHQPALIDAAADAGADLQLSGHTHGGQFVPWTWLVGFFNTYARGLHRHRDRTWIYVSCGSATWGPPMRLGAPTEVTALTLRSA